MGRQTLPSTPRSNPAVGQGVSSESLPHCASTPSPAKQGCRYEGGAGREGRVESRVVLGMSSFTMLLRI